MPLKSTYKLMIDKIAKNVMLALTPFKVVIKTAQSATEALKTLINGR